MRDLDWSNFDGPKRNADWKPDDQDLIYEAINFRDDDYGDADEDAGQQIVERLLAAWKRAEDTITRLRSERPYIVGCNDGFEEAILQAALVAGDYAGKQSPIAAAIRALSTPTSTSSGLTSP